MQAICLVMHQLVICKQVVLWCQSYCIVFSKNLGEILRATTFASAFNKSRKFVFKCVQQPLLFDLRYTNVIWHHFDFSNFLLSFCGISKMITDLAVELFVTFAVEVLRRLSTFGLYYLQPSHSFLHSTLLDFSILSFLPLIILHNIWTWQEAIMNTNQTSITPTKRWKGWFST